MWRKTLWIIYIPLVYFLCAFVLDIMLYAFIRVPFPQYYFVTVLLLVTIGCLVACIPLRSVQITVCGILLIFQMFFGVVNVIGKFNVDEIVSLEYFGSLKEIFSVSGVQKFDAVPYSMALASIVVIFFVITISAAVIMRLRKNINEGTYIRAGFRMRKVIAVVAAATVTFAAAFVNINLVRNSTTSFFDMTFSPGEAYATFHNRALVFNSFGTPAYYFGNFFHILGGFDADTVASKINLDWEDTSYYKDYKDSTGKNLMLDADTNLIFLMMETFEYDGINQNLTPTLWELRSKSTWVDGYYSKERTCFSEFTALTGGYVMGTEPWRDYRNVEFTQSLPNIFKNAFEQSQTFDGKPYRIGAFNGYDNSFYSRDIMFENMGFDFLRNQEYYGETYDKDLIRNSDVRMFQLMTADIAPRDKRFFSYVVNSSTHAPHYHSTSVYPVSSDSAQAPDTYRKAAVSTHPRSRNEIYETVLSYSSLEFVMNNYDTLAQTYPRLHSPHPLDRNATVAFLVAIREYDTGLEILLNHLKASTEGGKPVTPLINNTAIVLVADHYDYMAYGHYSNKGRGGVLSPTVTSTEYPNGEKAAFMIYNPRDTIVADKVNHPNNYPRGRKITTFMANNDIYKTICHLYNIPTHTAFTLGNSILREVGGTPEHVSVGITFCNGRILGSYGDPSLESNGFNTQNFRDFIGPKPDDEHLDAMRERLETYCAAMFKLRSYCDHNKFKSDPIFPYEMGKRSG